METRCKEEACNEVLAILDTMQEEPVSEKKCMFTKDNYTDEDRKVLCADCKEKCEYSKKEEPVSEDLEEEIQKNIHNHFFDLNGIAIAGTSVYATVDDMVYIAKHFANWQKEQMMKDAIDTTIKQGCIELGILIKGLDKGKFSFGDKVKVIIIKSE